VLGYEKYWEWPGSTRLYPPETQTAAATYAGSNAASMTNYYTQSRDWQMKFMCTERKSFCLCKNILKVVEYQKKNESVK